MPEEARTAVNSRYALLLDKVSAGFLLSVEGGHPTAEVITEKLGPDLVSRKHLGPLQYEDIIIRCGLAMGQPFLDWVNAAWGSSLPRKNGTIVLLDQNLNTISTLEFFNAFITEVGFPASDGAAKDASYLTIRIRPEYTRMKPTGEKLKIPLPRPDKRQWLSSNFQLDIEGLDCTKVSRIGSFTVKRSIPEDAIGEWRDYERMPGTMEIPNLKVTLAVTSAQSWYDWHEDFLVKGNCDEDREKSGTLEFLSPDLKTVLMRISLSNLGIFRFAAEQPDDQSQIRRVTADLYCQQMNLQIVPPVG